MSIMGNIPIRQDHSFLSDLKAKVPKLTKQNGIPVSIGMQKLPKSFKIPKIFTESSLKDSLQKAHEKLKT